MVKFVRSDCFLIYCGKINNEWSCELTSNLMEVDLKWNNSKGAFLWAVSQFNHLYVYIIICHMYVYVKLLSILINVIYFISKEHIFLSCHHLPSFNPCLTEYFYVQHSSPIFILLTCGITVIIRMENRVDPNQMASSEASCSGSTVYVF